MRFRRFFPEFADDPDADPRLLTESLGQMSAVNRWLGGDRGLRWALRPFVGSRPSFRVLDIGAGDGSVLARLVEWGKGRGCAVRGSALDLQSVACLAANERLGSQGGMGVVRGDAPQLPFRTGSFDVVLATLTLHHFSDDMAVRVLREMARVARERVVVSDLKRSWPAYLGARFLAATVWRRNPYTRHDGPVSVREGFTAVELLGLGQKAGLVDMVLRKHLPFRYTLVASPARTT